jgi:aspartyl/asparaginyl beta-hydroxylase (cupin superfamily)
MKRLQRKVCLFLWRAVDRLYYLHAGGPDRPVFFDVDRTCPALKAIDRNFDVIRAELEPLLAHVEKFPRYHEVDARQTSISAVSPGNWRTLFVHIGAAGKSFPNRRLFPRTAAVLDGIPGIGQAFFSILDPRKSIPAHDGPHHYYLRYHTAFVVPRRDPPTLRVKDRYHTWKEGESLLFDDSWNHEVMNESDGMRVVLITDVQRPAPWPLRLLHRAAFLVGRWGIPEREWEALFERFQVLEPTGTA